LYHKGPSCANQDWAFYLFMKVQMGTVLPLEFSGARWRTGETG